MAGSCLGRNIIHPLRPLAFLDRGLGIKFSPWLQTLDSSPWFQGSLLPPMLPSRQMWNQTVPGGSWGKPLPPSAILLLVLWGRTQQATSSSLNQLLLPPWHPRPFEGCQRVNLLILVTMRFQGWWEVVSMETGQDQCEELATGINKGPLRIQSKQEWEAQDCTLGFALAFLPSPVFSC